MKPAEHTPTPKEDARWLLACRITDYRNAANKTDRATKLALVVEAIEAFDRACVEEALQPRDPAPELAEAEKWLRIGVPDGFTIPEALNMSVIAAELDRLRGQVARQAEALDDLIAEAVVHLSCIQDPYQEEMDAFNDAVNRARALTARRCEEPRK